MPWHIEENHDDCPASSPFGVVKDDDGTLEGCHATRAGAEDQMAALYAAEADQEVSTLADDIAGKFGGKPNKGTSADQRLRRNKQRGGTKAAVDNEQDVTLEGPLRDWVGVLAVEGVETGDGREFAEGSLEWPNPNETIMNIMWQRESKERHQDSIVVGRIDDIWRDGNVIRGRGRIRSDAEVTEQMEQELAGGISIDVDSVKDTDVELIFPDEDEGVDADDDDIIMLLGPPPEKVVFHRGRVRGATLVALPAFVEARIYLVEQMNEEELSNDLDAVTAAGVPVHPPAEWFTNPELSGPTPWTVADDGRVYGHLALWSSCHTTFPDRCITPPREGDFPYFMRREVKTREGELVGTGPITLGTGHAALRLGAVPAARHYDDTGLGAVDVAVGEDRWGIWVAGAVRPTVDDARLRELRGSSLSGDWRRIAGRLRLVAVLAVNVPGYPIPRMKATTEGERWSSMVAAGVVTEQRRDFVLGQLDDGTIRVRRVRT